MYVVTTICKSGHNEKPQLQNYNMQLNKPIGIRNIFSTFKSYVNSHMYGFKTNKVEYTYKK